MTSDAISIVASQKRNMRSTALKLMMTWACRVKLLLLLALADLPLQIWKVALTTFNKAGITAAALSLSLHIGGAPANFQLPATLNLFGRSASYGRKKPAANYRSV
jgi:hypothetical protein